MSRLSMKDLLQAAKRKPTQTTTTTTVTTPGSTAEPIPANPTSGTTTAASPRTTLTPDERIIVEKYSQQSFTPSTPLEQSPIYQLERYALHPLRPDIPPAVYLIPDFISSDESSQLSSLIDSSPACMWHQLKRRKLQMWGGFPQPNQPFIPDPLPQWQEQLIDRICQTIQHQANVTSSSIPTESEPSLVSSVPPPSVPFFPPDLRPNHILLNSYASGEGIMAHQDGPLYHSRVAILSLQSHTIMHFYSHLSNSLPSQHRPSISIYIPPRSLFIFTEGLYTRYFHAIEERTEDELKAPIVNIPDELMNTTVQRETRISLTIRRVREDARS